MQTYDSDRFHQRLDYKIFSPSVDWSTVKPHWLATVPIQELNVQTVITAPSTLNGHADVPDRIQLSIHHFL